MTEILQTYRDAAKWANNLPREDFNKVLLLINKREETIEQETVTKIIALAAEWMGDIEFAQFKHRVEAEEWK